MTTVQPGEKMFIWVDSTWIEMFIWVDLKSNDKQNIVSCTKFWTVSFRVSFSYVGCGQEFSQGLLSTPLSTFYITAATWEIYTSWKSCFCLSCSLILPLVIHHSHGNNNNDTNDNTLFLTKWFSRLHNTEAKAV